MFAPLSSLGILVVDAQVVDRRETLTKLLEKSSLPGIPVGGVFIFSTEPDRNLYTRKIHRPGGKQVAEEFFLNFFQHILY